MSNKNTGDMGKIQGWFKIYCPVATQWVQQNFVSL